jgi:hypothetical protein
VKCGLPSCVIKVLFANQEAIEKTGELATGLFWGELGISLWDRAGNRSFGEAGFHVLIAEQPLRGTRI